MVVIMIILVAVVIILLLALYALYTSYEYYLDVEEENERLSRLLEDCFWIQNDSLEAYREMLNVACRESGFWETEDDIVDVDE